MPEDLSDSILKRIEKLNFIGIALSAEKNFDRLLEMILLGAKELTNADAGTLYSVTEERSLKFEIVRTDSLKIAMGGTTGTPIHFPRIPLYGQDGAPNLRMIAAYAAVKDETVNVPDAYEAEGFDFSGTKNFDAKTGYRSKSFLTIPLKNHEMEMIGVLQLINARDPGSPDGIGPFSREDQQLAESLASQAAITLTNKKLIENLKDLFESFIRVIANAIDAKSPYTGGHCHRVPVLAEMIAQAAMACKSGSLASFDLSVEEQYELKIAAWLHDCGKVTTPEHVVDKGTKLETVFDRIGLLDLRFALLKRDLEIAHLNRRMAALERGEPPPDDARLAQEIEALEDDREFLHECNQGSEFMSEDKKERVKGIASQVYRDQHGREVPFLTEDEVENLLIPRGTLTAEERETINNHVVATYKMLSALPFPKTMARVPEIAAAHHEKMDGKGYPKGLTGEQLSVQAKILAIADVFEALTAADRPYKRGKTLSQALRILGFMKKDGHIDPDLFQIFVEDRIYERYAVAHLDASQRDRVNPGDIPGYEPSTV